MDQAGKTGDIRNFVAHLHKHDRLTASLLLRALAHGHMSFFEWGLSQLSAIPHHRTWMMVHDAGPLGLRAIYERTGLPARLFPAFRAAVDVGALPFLAAVGNFTASKAELRYGMLFSVVANASVAVERSAVLHLDAPDVVDAAAAASCAGRAYAGLFALRGGGPWSLDRAIGKEV